MVSHTGESLPLSRIRRVSQPREVRVKADEMGGPQALLLAGRWTEVKCLRRPWRIDQHWWTEAPVSRMYYQLAPKKDGPPVTVYRDLLTGAWHEQRY
jgi:hypothetical protein